MKYTFIALMIAAVGCLAMVMNQNSTQPTKTSSHKAKCTKTGTECSETTRKNCCMEQKVAQKSCCTEKSANTALASLRGGGGENAPAEEVKFFSGSWKELLAKASKDKKPFWVDVYTTWCGPCKMMSKLTFTDDVVGKASNKSFLAYKADAENGDGIKIASDYNVDAYPTILFFSADGKLLGREEGMQDAEKFEYTLNKYLKKTGKSKKSKK